uniref:Uncharacterized protein n=1 Tax=Rhodnius prolixus TaxID=13249 RepID=T1IA93_RHOPR
MAEAFAHLNENPRTHDRQGFPAHDGNWVIEKQHQMYQRPDCTVIPQRVEFLRTEQSLQPTYWRWMVLPAVRELKRVTFSFEQNEGR